MAVSYPAASVVANFQERQVMGECQLPERNAILLRKDEVGVIQPGHLTTGRTRITSYAVKQLVKHAKLVLDSDDFDGNIVALASSVVYQDNKVHGAWHRVYWVNAPGCYEYNPGENELGMYVYLDDTEKFTERELVINREAKAAFLCSDCTEINPNSENGNMFNGKCPMCGVDGGHEPACPIKDISDDNRKLIDDVLENRYDEFKKKWDKEQADKRQPRIPTWPVPPWMPQAPRYPDPDPNTVPCPMPMDSPWSPPRQPWSPSPVYPPQFIPPAAPASGWVCPRCGTGCAPHVSTCPNCTPTQPLEITCGQG